MMKGYDIVGNIAIVKFPRGISDGMKRKKAEKLLKEMKSVRTILEKAEGFSGRLRLQKTKWLAGERTKEALYKENGCVFRFNVDTCYFSPRLASERLKIAKKVRKGERVLVMFGGVAPFAIVIGKLSKAGRIVSVELGRDCNKYALENVKRNKLRGKVEIVGGDVRKVIGKGKKVDEKFDRIVMARPNLKDSFLDVVLKVVRRNGVIHYYGFSSEDELERMKKELIDEALKRERKVKIMKVERAGEIGSRRYRYRLDLKVR